MRWWLLIILLLPGLLQARENEIPLLHYRANIADHISLQRGARLFINYCSGCHSMQYMRYKRLAADTGMTDDYGVVFAQVVKKNLIFTDADITDTIHTAMTPAEGKRWFGVAPPDLTLEARVRGAAWLYTYLRTFYKDPRRPWGANNLVFPDVAMPNILLNLQGEQTAVFRHATTRVDGELKEIDVFDHLAALNNGTMPADQFDQAVRDLVNFLVYAGEPMKLEQQRLGWFVLLFLIVFSVLCYLLKRVYWKKIH